MQIAEPGAQVVAVIGDGSAMYSITALWSAANQKLPVIFMITNNAGYQILKNRLKLFHGNDTPIGMDFNDPPMDITKIAEGFGVTAERVDTAAGFDAALTRRWPRPTAPACSRSWSRADPAKPFRTPCVVSLGVEPRRQR